VLFFFIEGFEAMANLIDTIHTMKVEVSNER